MIMFLSPKRCADCEHMKAGRERRDGKKPFCYCGHKHWMENRKLGPNILDRETIPEWCPEGSNG